MSLWHLLNADNVYSLNGEFTLCSLAAFLLLEIVMYIYRMLLAKTMDFLPSIKQHLRIKRSYGATESAVKCEIRMDYFRVAIIMKRLHLVTTVCNFYRFCRSPSSRKLPSSKPMQVIGYDTENIEKNMQLNLFDS